MKFEETKKILNDLLFQFNGHKQNSGLEKITEAMGGCFLISYKKNDEKYQLNINPKSFSCKGELCKEILNAIY
ncbi:MAG: hypothetical protein ACI4UK_03280 [Floccifex sp.]